MILRDPATVGGAYVFDLNSTSPTIPVATLKNPTTSRSDSYGFAVAISGTHVAVGAPGADTDSYDTGTAYVYDLNSGTPTVPLAVLSAPDAVPGDSFGYSVAVSGALMVVGAYDEGTFEGGSAYVYDLGSETPTVAVLRLPNPNPSIFDNFGYSVAISGTRVVVGVPDRFAGAFSVGRAYVYDLGSGTPTVPMVTLDKPNPAGDDNFGWSVAISDSRVVVGAWRDDTGARNAGSAYVYDLSGGTPTVPVVTLNDPTPKANNYFGFSVAISGTGVVVGAFGHDAKAHNAGRAYVYDLSGSTPAVPVAAFNNPRPVANDYFGWSVGISGSRVVVGAPFADKRAINAGTAYLYDLAGTTLNLPVAILKNPRPMADDNFGYSVSISGRRMVVGAYRDDTGALNAGSAYVYDLANATPAWPVAKLGKTIPTRRDHFGRAVALDGGTVVVGTPNDDSTAFDKGAAYVFEFAP